MNHREEIRQYHEREFPHGVLEAHSSDGSVRWFEASTNLLALENRERFQFNMGSHPCRELQALWTTVGPESVIFRVAAEWKPTKGQTPSQIRDDLEALLELLRDQGRTDSLKTGAP